MRWSERHVVRTGFDPSIVHRSFKRQFGMTFLDVARQRRLPVGFGVLPDGGKVIAVQHEARLESASAFRAAFARLLGCPPASLTRTGMLLASWIDTPLGDVIAVSSASHLRLLEFVDRKALPSESRTLQSSAKERIEIGRSEPVDRAETELAAFFAGNAATFETPLA